jgi:dienelactone hydrolase
MQAIWIAFCAVGASAQDMDTSVNEQIVMVAKKGGLFSFELETTIYKPDGDGPFPLVVINHGKALGDPRFQGRSRNATVARFFLQRGYAVLMPMRQGFSKSTGSYIGGGCNIDSNGLQQAQDVKAVLDWATSQNWADKGNILVMGQSHGGWTTLAFGTLNYPGVKALVNFAGGLRQDSCAGWEGSLARAASGYGKETRTPSLWFYGDNDSYFAPYTFKPMFEKYTAAGANSELVAFGNFGSDAHSMFGSRAGLPIWQPKVNTFMQANGLPTTVKYPQYGNAPSTLPIPTKSDFAALDDESKLPFVKDTGRAGYKNFLTKQLPRAFAIAPNGAWAWAELGDDPLKRALDNCNRNGQGQCKLYAVDDQVVWQP